MAVRDPIERLFAHSFRFLPTNWISRNWGRLTRTAWSQHLIRPFARAFRIDVSEAEHAIDDYESLCAFFTRRLKPGLRPIDAHADAVVSPVDGKVAQAGQCEQDRLLQVKGRSYDLFGLLRDAEASSRLEGGSFVTLYLSPQDYHRIHAPLDMTIRSVSYMPGVLYPVNGPAMRWVNNLYSNNERVMVYADTSAGLCVMVLVGAHCVGSIRLCFADLSTNRPGVGPNRLNFPDGIRVPKGDEVGVFEMGSTVILLFEPQAVEWLLPEPGLSIRVGQRIASVRKPAAPTTGGSGGTK